MFTTLIKLILLKTLLSSRDFFNAYIKLMVDVIHALIYGGWIKIQVSHVVKGESSIVFTVCEQLYINMYSLW